MNDDKQYLFPSGGSHFLGCLLALGLIGVSMYDLLWGGCTIMRNGNVQMDAILVFLLLAYTFMLEACMMIISRGYLFAYNVDKAICVRIKGHDVKSAVLIGRRLYGPIFDGNCETQFSSSPKSSTIRNCFYMAIIIMLFVSLIAPCYHFINAFRAGVWSSDLIVAWLFIFLDAFLIINRVFFRASIRRFWARTLGDDNFRAILDFELSNKEDSALLPHSVVTDEKDLCSDRIPGYTNRVPSQKRLILTGVILIMLVVWALNSRRNKPTQIIPNMNNVSTERGQAK